MRIILSRKGFDSSVGGFPSPIIAGVPLSLPIPERAGLAGTPYSALSVAGHALADIIRDLGRGRLSPAVVTHRDPDLHTFGLVRDPAWRPVFGQIDAAETHLRAHNVGAGDVFLFFGWFRAAERTASGVYQWVRGAPNLHMLFGWLQVQQHLDLGRGAAVPSWAADHPHAVRGLRRPTEGLYISTERLSLPGCPATVPGAGRFERIAPLHILTAPGALRSRWRLPGWFYPTADPLPALTYHGDPRRWTHAADGATLLQSAAQGQEFILDADRYPEAVAWTAEIIAAGV